MEIVDLRGKIERIGAQRAEASAALRRAILAHRSPGEIEDLEVECMELDSAFRAACSDHFVATVISRTLEVA